MTNDEYLDNERLRGTTIYRCQTLGCTFRGFGRADAIHNNKPGHRTYNEACPSCYVGTLYCTTAVVVTAGAEHPADGPEVPVRACNTCEFIEEDTTES